MRILAVVAFVVVLAFLGSQLNAGREPAGNLAQMRPADIPLVVGTTFPEPISTVFVLGGAAALGLWKLAQKFKLI